MSASLPAGIESRAMAVRRWTLLLATTGAAQAALQALAFVAGIVVVRLLAPEQYALYTIAWIVSGAMTVLADSGVTSGAMAIGGRVWQDRRALGGVLAAALALRRRFALAALALGLPAAFLLLRHQSVEPLAAAAVCGAIALPFLATLTTNLLEVVPKLHQDLSRLQRIQLSTGLVRVAATVAAVLLWPVAAFAIAVTAAPQWWNNRRLAALAGTAADADAAPDPAARRELLRYVRRSLPLAAYYAVSSQLTLVLVSLLGETHEIAAVGALGRLAALYALVGAVVTMIGVPRFARLDALDRRRVLSRYWQIHVVVGLACFAPVALVALAPGPVLAVLGPHYAGLAREALLMIVGGATGAIGGLALQLSVARGFVMPPTLAIPVCVALQAALVAALPVDTVAGVLWLGILSNVGQWLLHVAWFLNRVRHSPAEAPA